MLNCLEFLSSSELQASSFMLIVVALTFKQMCDILPILLPTEVLSKYSSMHSSIVNANPGRQVTELTTSFSAFNLSANQVTSHLLRHAD